jgi:RHS repeat-associated protein
MTSAVKTGTTRGWSYDANGNRLTETGSAASTYTISTTNNRISSISGALPRTYSYDPAGNVLSYATVTATYNNRGRMKTLTKGAVTASYVYNALGQFVKQSGGPSGTLLYVYDEAGHLLGEYTATGTLIQETLWMGDTPVASIRPGTPSLYYVHTDHLNTPRRVTRPSDNKLMWSWYSDPFGADLPNENPAAGGTFKYNLRFPGQLYDSQAGLSQNYFRDYDPAIGRYVQSDPIGLKGGINTYAYANENPVSRIDPSGLWGRVRVEDWAQQDYSACSYYDQVAKTFGCKYHQAAGRICRGGHLGVNLLLDSCGLLNTAKLNCVRRCLARKDAEARQDPSCQKGPGGCSTSGCTRLSCINRYHNECFTECGAGVACYGGNYWQGFPNDGD